VKQAKYQKLRKLREPGYKEFLADYQRMWVAANPERNKELKRNAYRRKKMWTANSGKLKVNL
jgi:hypothetical protein